MNTPLILAYNLNNPKGSRLRLICLKLRIRVRDVSAEEYGLPVGALAGLTVGQSAEAGEPFDDEMLVMVNFDGKLLNLFLQETRAARVPGVALKAILTPTNMEWTSRKLHEELKKEHEAMRYGQTAHSKNP